MPLHIKTVENSRNKVQPYVNLHSLIVKSNFYLLVSIDIADKGDVMCDGCGRIINLDFCSKYWICLKCNSYFYCEYCRFCDKAHALQKCISVEMSKKSIF